MKVIDPEVIGDAALSSTNVAETLTAWDATTYYVTGDTRRVDSTHLAYESLVGDAPATVTITIASPGVVTHTGHSLSNNDPVAISTTGALPTGLTAHTVYYARNVTATTYELSATSGGASINTTGGQSGTHTGHGHPNRGNDPTLDASAAYWLNTGSTNPWTMFDQYIESQTENADTIEVSLVPAGRADAIALFNLDAASVTVTGTDPVDGVVFGPTVFPLTATDNVFDWYSYFFSPIIRKSSLLVEGLPPYIGLPLDIVIDNTGGTAKCGLLTLGLETDLGDTVYGAGFGIIDGSLKTIDDFQRTTITQRAFRSTGTLRVIVPKARVDYVRDFLAARRAVFSVFIGTGEYDSLLIYGFPRSWDVTIEYPEQSALKIELESTS